MIKLAMIKIHHEMQTGNWESKMILQVHDELVFDAVLSEADDLQNLIINCMVNALPLPNKVPVEAEVGRGKNWLEAH
jgi:DNA polymerase-1